MSSSDKHQSPGGIQPPPFYAKFTKELHETFLSLSEEETAAVLDIFNYYAVQRKLASWVVKNTEIASLTSNLWTLQQPRNPAYFDDTDKKNPKATPLLHKVIPFVVTLYSTLSKDQTVIKQYIALYRDKNIAKTLYSETFESDSAEAAGAEASKADETRAGVVASTPQVGGAAALPAPIDTTAIQKPIFVPPTPANSPARRPPPTPQQLAQRLASPGTTTGSSVRRPPPPINPGNMANPIPQTFKPSHIDSSFQINQVPAASGDYEPVTMVSPAGAQAPGFAILVKSGDNKTRVSNYVLSMNPIISTMDIYYTSLSKQNLDFEANPDISNLSDIEQELLATVQSQYEKMVEAANHLKKIEEKILALCKNSSMSAVNNFFLDLLSQQAALQPRIRLYLNKRKIPAGQLTTNAAGNLSLNTTMGVSSNVTGHNTSLPNTYAVKLGGKKFPQVELNHFSGQTKDYMRWSEDFTNYITKYVTNGELDYYQAMNYLKQSMPTKYQDEMANYPWNKDGFDRWLNELSSRHGDKTQLCLTWRKVLQNLKSPKDHLDSFVAFRNNVLQATDGLILAGITAAQEGEQWMSYILPRLTEQQRNSWLSHKDILEQSQPNVWAGDVPFGHFKNWMAKYEKQLRTNASYQKLLPQEPKKNNNNRVSADTHASSSKPAVQAQAAGKKKKQEDDKPYSSITPKTCCFCSGNHPPEKCNGDISKADAWRQAFDAGLCACCLRSGHRPPKCEAKRKCSKKDSDGKPCSYQHHPKLHEAKYLSMKAYRGLKQ